MTASTQYDAMIEDYLTYLRRRRRSPRTITTYEPILRRAALELPYGLPVANAPEIEDWVCHPDRPATTQRLMLSALSGFFRWMIRTGHGDYDPTLEIDRPSKPRRVPRVPTDTQVADILTRAREPVRLWSVIAAYSGARAIEIERLDRCHVAEDATQLWGKGDAERLVPTHPRLWDVVRLLPAGPLSGSDAAASIANKTWREYRQLGHELSIHRLRAWYATTLLRNGVDIATVSELLGHRSIATTQAYLGVARPQMVAAVAALPDLAAEVGPGAAPPATGGVRPRTPSGVAGPGEGAPWSPR